MDARSRPTQFKMPRAQLTGVANRRAPSPRQTRSKEQEGNRSRKHDESHHQPTAPNTKIPPQGKHQPDRSLARGRTESSPAPGGRSDPAIEPGGRAGAPPGPGAPPQRPAAAAAGAGEILAGGLWCARKGAGPRATRWRLATGEQGVSGQGVRRFGGF